MASGGAAGAASLLFVYSLDYARTRLANDAKSAKGGGARQFNGLVDVYKKTLASDGLAGLYRGFVPSVVGIVVYRGLYFGVYDSLSAYLHAKYAASVSDLFYRARCPRWCSPGFLLRFVLARLGCYHWCWSCLIPARHDSVSDVAAADTYPCSHRCSRRMMMTSGAGVHYKSMFDAGSQIVAKEGTKSLFKGAGANILRGVAGAGVLSLYDKLQEVVFGKVYSGGMSSSSTRSSECLIVCLQALAKRICHGHFASYKHHSTTVYLARYTTPCNRLCSYLSGCGHISISVVVDLESKDFVYQQRKRLKGGMV